MLLIWILFLLNLTLAQLPKPCVSPQRWEARVHSYNWQLQADLHGRLSYDSIYQRTRVRQDTRVGQTETRYDIITLYQAQLSFYINMKTGVCSRVPNAESWRDYGIQTDARSLGEAYLGSSTVSGEGLLVTQW
jgi:hypothetical protein